MINNNKNMDEISRLLKKDYIRAESLNPELQIKFHYYYNGLKHKIPLFFKKLSNDIYHQNKNN